MRLTDALDGRAIGLRTGRDEQCIRLFARHPIDVDLRRGHELDAGGTRFAQEILHHCAKVLATREALRKQRLPSDLCGGLVQDHTMASRGGNRRGFQTGRPGADDHH